jgi:putative transposase
MCRSKNIRLAPTSYVGQQHYFVTICCSNRTKIFANRARCLWLLEVFRSECAARNFTIHAYCLMPDHFHFLAEGLIPASDMLNLIKSFKLKTSRTYSRQTSQILWQRKFYDHVLRPKESPESVACYIWQNPVRKGLCTTPQDYSFNGSFTSTMSMAPKPTATWLPPWRKPASV